MHTRLPATLTGVDQNDFAASPNAPDPGPQASPRPDPPGNAELTELLKTYGPDHPRILTLKQNAGQPEAPAPAAR